MKTIKSKVEDYILYSQLAYRANRSTTYIIWAHHLIIAKLMLYQNMDVQITGLCHQLSINREELMQILQLILEEDEIRMCQLFLKETSMTLHSGNDFTESFETNKGLPQGDSISGAFLKLH